MECAHFIYLNLSNSETVILIIPWMYLMYLKFLYRDADIMYRMNSHIFFGTVLQWNVLFCTAMCISFTVLSCNIHIMYSMNSKMFCKIILKWHVHFCTVMYLLCTVWTPTCSVDCTVCPVLYCEQFTVRTPNCTAIK